MTNVCHKNHREQIQGLILKLDEYAEANPQWSPTHLYHQAYSDIIPENTTDECRASFMRMLTSKHFRADLKKHKITPKIVRNENRFTAREKLRVVAYRLR